MNTSIQDIIARLEYARRQLPNQPMKGQACIKATVGRIAFHLQQGGSVNECLAYSKTVQSMYEKEKHFEWSVMGCVQNILNRVNSDMWQSIQNKLN